MLADAVASAVLRRYASLPKHGKPQPGEYTLLAGFAVTDDAVPDAPPRVVALGTGTKCLPASSRCPRGEALSDSHAEVIARRAFVRFLYDELERAMEDDGDALRDAGVARDETNENAASPKPIVEWVAGASTTTPFRLRGGVRVHLYATQSPCGDASIFELATETRPAARAARADGETSREAAISPEGDVFDARSKECAVSANASARKRAKTSSGGSGASSSFSFAGATGAKLFVNAVNGTAKEPFDDAGRSRVDRESGARGQTLGACRLKPGRGARTDCMSCSDKIARWVALGAQGALLSSLIERGTASGEGTRKRSFGHGAVRLASVVVSAPDAASAAPAASAAAAAAAAAGRRNVLAATRRALVDRVDVLNPEDAPGVFVVAPAPPELSSSAGQSRGWVASGTAVNWYWRRAAHPSARRSATKSDAEAAGTEVTLGATGRRAGFSKKARSSKKAQSRLCRASLAARFGEVVVKIRARQRRDATDGCVFDGEIFADDGSSGATLRETTYETLKRLCSAAYAEGAASFRAPPSPFASWSAKHPEVGRTFKVFTAGS